MKPSVRRGLALAALHLAVAGCNKPDEVKPPQAAKAPAGEPQAVAPAEVFKPPVPTESVHDPRVIALKASTDRITASLTAVRDRLDGMRKALDTRPATENDLYRTAGDLKPLTTQAREDCDAMRRLADDLRHHLPAGQRGYSATAVLYRDRAEGYADPALKEVTLRFADEFDRLAATTAERVALTDTFIAQLTDAGRFLAEADRCLGDTRTALEILSAGPTPVRVSAEAKAFRRHLENFMALVDDYQSKLLGTPPTAPAPRPVPPTAAPPTPAPPTDTPPTPKPQQLNEAGPVPPGPDCPPAPPPTHPELVTDPKAPGMPAQDRYRCPHCGRDHERHFRVLLPKYEREILEAWEAEKKKRKDAELRCRPLVDEHERKCREYEEKIKRKIDEYNAEVERKLWAEGR